MRYTLIKETIKDELLGDYESFGIQSESGHKISDISTDIEDVKKLLSTINAKHTPENYIGYEIDRMFSEI